MLRVARAHRPHFGKELLQLPSFERIVEAGFPFVAIGERSLDETLVVGDEKRFVIVTKIGVNGADRNVTAQSAAELDESVVVLDTVVGLLDENAYFGVAAADGELPDSFDKRLRIVEPLVHVARENVERMRGLLGQAERYLSTGLQAIDG